VSDLYSKRARSTEARKERAVACFCEQCDRLLYVREAEWLFCPVCSSMVSRVDAHLEVTSGERRPVE